MATFKDRIEDLAGTIPTTADGEQFLKDGVVDVVHKTIATHPQHLPLFTKQVTIASPSSGEDVHDVHVSEVTKDGTSCREIPASGRHAATDSASLHYASDNDPIYYFLNEKIYIKPASGTQTFSILEHGDVTNWDSGTSSIAYMPSHHYNQVIMYAAIQVLYHRLVETAMPTDITLETLPSLALPIDLPNAPVAPPLVSFASFNSIGDLSITSVPPDVPVANIPAYVPPTISGGSGADDLSDMIDSSWTSLDFDFDDENIDFSTWFQTVGDMIQNQEDVELASMQLQKIATYVSSYSAALQNRLNIFNTKMQDHSAAQGLYQAELGQYQQEVNAQIGEYTQNLGKAMQAWGGEQQNQLGLYGADLQKYQSQLGSSQQEVGTKISEYTQNLQNIAQKNSALLQDFGSKIQKVSGEYQWIQGQIGMLKQQYNESFTSTAGA